MHFDINILILISLSLFFMLFGIFYSKNFKSLSLYLNAGRSVKSWSLTSSIVASCFGVWILIGPAEAATWGGLGAVIGYALGQACPYLAFRIFGKRLRTLMPNGNSLTQFVYVRYGFLALRVILFITLFYIFIYLCAEVTAIAKIVNLITGLSLWKTSLLILITTLIYTLRGGLRISILTDKFQFVIISFFLIFIFYFLFFSGNINISKELIAFNTGPLISSKYFYGYTAGITFFIAVFATNLFDQGMWQRVFSAQSDNDLDVGFRNAFFIILPVILILGFCGIIGVSLGLSKTPSIIIFSLLLQNQAEVLSSIILILALTLVISSMDTLINAISSLLIIEGKKFITFNSNISYLNFSRMVLIILSIIIFYISSQGLSVLYMFLLADLLCCAAAVPVFYGMFKNNISEKNTIIAIIFGLIFGLLLFPDITFQKSILVGVLFSSSLFPLWISTALLFWSFVLAIFIPSIVILLLKENKNRFDFNKVKRLVADIN